MSHRFNLERRFDQHPNFKTDCLFPTIMKMKTDFLGLLKPFTEPRINRFEFLKEFVEKYKIPHEEILTGGARHLLLRSRQKPSRPNLAVKTLMAHYDRHPKSPGANDNSAAVVHLLLQAAE